MSKKSFLTLIFCFVLFSGCANTRDPLTCPMKNSDDKITTCDEIYAEYRSNTISAKYKIDKNNSEDIQDILVGFFIWPGLADFKNADGIEGNAILDRNLYLIELAKIKNCNTVNYPEQPSRYK